MLKQVRHISEGNFYGLRVTNNAQKLDLDRKIRTLDTCKDMQSHVYRKEEQELESTLKRLQDSKHDCLVDSDDFPDRRTPSHHRPTSFHSRHQLSTDKLEHLRRRPSEQSKRKIQVNLSSDVNDATSVTKVPYQVSVLADTSDVNIIISVAPKASSVDPVAKQSEVSSFPPLVRPLQRGASAGAEIHRTRGFLSCVVCNLPRYAQGRESNHVCACPPQCSKPPPHGHHPSNNQSNLHAEDDRYKRHTRGSLGNGDHPARHHLRHAPHNTQRAAGSRTSGLEDDNTSHTSGPHGRNNKQNPIDNDHRLKEQERHSRESSFGEHKTWRSSFDNSSRTLWSTNTEGRSRDNSLGESDNRSYKGRRGSRHSGNCHEEELYNLLERLQKMFPSQTREVSNDNKNDQDPEPVFTGLIHPNNVINHHHFLPYEAAHKKDKTLQASKHHTAHDTSHPLLPHLSRDKKAVSTIYFIFIMRTLSLI